MWTEFNKGQIVGRRLDLIGTTLRKSRHSFTFGSHCLVRGKRVVNTDVRTGPAFHIKHNRRRHNNGTYQEGHCTVVNLDILGIDPSYGDAFMPYAQWWLRQTRETLPLKPENMLVTVRRA